MSDQVTPSPANPPQNPEASGLVENLILGIQEGSMMTPERAAKIRELFQSRALVDNIPQSQVEGFILDNFETNLDEKISSEVDKMLEKPEFSELLSDAVKEHLEDEDDLEELVSKVIDDMDFVREDDIDEFVTGRDVERATEDLVDKHELSSLEDRVQEAEEMIEKLASKTDERIRELTQTTASRMAQEENKLPDTFWGRLTWLFTGRKS